VVPKGQVGIIQLLQVHLGFLHGFTSLQRNVFVGVINPGKLSKLPYAFWFCGADSESQSLKTQKILSFHEIKVDPQDKAYDKVLCEQAVNDGLNLHARRQYFLPSEEKRTNDGLALHNFIRLLLEQKQRHLSDNKRTNNSLNLDNRIEMFFENPFIVVIRCQKIMFHSGGRLLVGGCCFCFVGTRLRFTGAGLVVETRVLW
jgi:hypothetical protein